MTCATPIADEALIDYVARDLDAAASDALEAHVFECDACAARLEAIAALADRVASLARSAKARVAATSALVKRWQADGLKLRQYEVAPGGSVKCTVSADDDYVISWLDADFAPDEPVTLVSRVEGREISRIVDVPVDRQSGSVVMAVPGDIMRTFPDVLFHMQLEQGEGAAARVIGDYYFDHVRDRPE